MQTFADALNDPDTAAAFHGGPMARRPRPLQALLAELDAEDEEELLLVKLPLKGATVAGVEVASWHCRQFRFADMLGSLVDCDDRQAWKVERLYQQIVGHDQNGRDCQLTREQLGQLPYKLSKVMLLLLERTGLDHGPGGMPVELSGDLINQPLKVRLTEDYGYGFTFTATVETLGDLEVLASGGTAIERVEDLLRLSNMPDILDSLNVTDGTFLLQQLTGSEKEARKVLQVIRSFEAEVGQFDVSLSMRRFMVKQQGFLDHFKKRNAAQKAAAQKNKTATKGRLPRRL